MVLAAGVLVSGRSSPAEVLLGARRRRARLAVARGPAWCSSLAVSSWIRAGGGSGGWNPGLGLPGGSSLLRRRRWLRQGGRDAAGGLSPCPFIGLGSVAAWRTALAAVFNKEGALGAW